MYLRWESHICTFNLQQVADIKRFLVKAINKHHNIGQINSLKSTKIREDKSHVNSLHGSTCKQVYRRHENLPVPVAWWSRMEIITHAYIHRRIHTFITGTSILPMGISSFKISKSVILKFKFLDTWRPLPPRGFVLCSFKPRRVL